MKILIFADAEATHSQRFIKLMLGCGFEVVHVDKSYTTKKVENRLICFPYPDPSRSNILSIIRPYRLKKKLFKWYKIISIKLIKFKFKPDIIHVHGIGNSARLCYLANLTPVIFTAWGSDVNDYFPLELSDKNKVRDFGQVLRHAIHITADSEKIIERMNEIAQVKLNTSIYQYGININLFRPYSLDQKRKFKSELGLKDEVKIILSVRRVTEKMQQLEILEAFAKLSEHHKDKVTIIFRKMAGNDLIYFNLLIEEIKKMKLEDHVIILDMVDYELLPNYYNLADVIVNFAMKDAVPVSLFEASACKRPIITSDLDDYSLLFNDDGFYKIKPNDVDSLFKNLDVILFGDLDVNSNVNKNYDLIKRIGDENYNFNQLQKIYKAIIAEN